MHPSILNLQTLSTAINHLWYLNLHKRPVQHYSDIKFNVMITDSDSITVTPARSIVCLGLLIPHDVEPPVCLTASVLKPEAGQLHRRRTLGDCHDAAGRSLLPQLQYLAQVRAAEASQHPRRGVFRRAACRRSESADRRPADRGPADQRRWVGAS